MKPVFVDVKIPDLTIDEEKIRSAITPLTKAIIPIHMFGLACEMDVITDISEYYGLFVIEDAAQALGATFKGKKLGTLGDIGIYSFGVGKNITGGGGGALSINSARMLEIVEGLQLPIRQSNKLRRIVKFATRGAKLLGYTLFWHPELYPVIAPLVTAIVRQDDLSSISACLGTKKMSKRSKSEAYLMSSSCASIIRCQLQQLDNFNRIRRRNAFTIYERLKNVTSNSVAWPADRTYTYNVYTRCPILIKRGNRQSIINRFISRKVECSTPYSYLANLLPKIGGGLCRNALYAATKALITLPNHPHLTQQDMHLILSLLDIFRHDSH
jgi:dTDP-4-amino-4,6-dideoxygalactose transaminase